MTSRAKDLVGYSFLVAFANDDTIDEAELAFLERLALEDAVVDEPEREALRSIFERVDERRTAAAVIEEMKRFRDRYGI